MKKKILFISLIMSGLSLTFYSCTDGSKSTAVKNEGADSVKTEDLVKQGEHLVNIMGCNDCHSPKKMGQYGPELIPDKLLSGYPSDRPIVKFDSKMIQQGFPMFYPDLTAGAGPWGLSFAANLTPDETGLGSWTEEQFKKALTEGKFKGLDGGRSLLPPMPWQNYKALTDKEIHAIFTYLKSLKPVKNLVPDPVSPDQK